MLKTIYLGKLSGIQLYIHWTFWLLVIFLGVRDLADGVEAAFRSISLVFLVFFCVFLHELGHAFAGRIYRVQTLDITLYPIGGVARMQMKNLSPTAELVIAACGPLVNLVIAAVLATTMAISGNWNDLTNIASMGLMQQLLVVNIALFVFNLLPVYPMDGGRILRALLNYFVKRDTAVEWTARLGQVLAAIIAIYGLVTLQLTLVIIFAIMFFACSAELFKARLRAAMMRNGNSGFPFPGGSMHGQMPDGWDRPSSSPFEGFHGHSQFELDPRSHTSQADDIIDAEQVKRLP